jgi:RNA polymerase sigma-70 factor (ECF subfamily)
MSLMQNAVRTPEYLLKRARSGDSDAFGELLSQYQNYLRLLARTLTGQTFPLRRDSSDLVQEAFLEAHRDFPQFLGSTEAELLAWLRRILLRNLTDHARHENAALRDHRRQRSLEMMVERSSSSLLSALAESGTTASAVADRRERAVLLGNALADLPADYREVVMLRNLEGLKFNEVAARMGRTSGAVRMLWARAIERLSLAMEGLS